LIMIKYFLWVFGIYALLWATVLGIVGFIMLKSELKHWRKPWPKIKVSEARR